MGCGNRKAWRSYFKEEAQRFQSGFGSTGNRAFDAYRGETLKRLEEEADEFQAFLKRLRDAKDKAEFDQFMADRRNAQANDAQASGAPATDTPPSAAPTGGGAPAFA